VRGLDGDDYFAVDDNAAITTLDGGAGNDTFQIGQIYGEPRISLPGRERQPGDRSGRRRLRHDPHDARLRQPRRDLRAHRYGGTGDDNFTVYSTSGAAPGRQRRATTSSWCRRSRSPTAAAR